MAPNLNFPSLKQRPGRYFVPLETWDLILRWRSSVIPEHVFQLRSNENLSGTKLVASSRNKRKADYRDTIGSTVFLVENERRWKERDEPVPLISDPVGARVAARFISALPSKLVGWGRGWLGGTGRGTEEVNEISYAAPGAKSRT